MTSAEVITRAVSRYQAHHDGYRLSGGYVAAPVLVASARPASEDLTVGLNDILGFALAEVIGGIGPGQRLDREAHSADPTMALILGLDLLRADLPEAYRYSGSVQRHDGQAVPVYGLDPALDAASTLLRGWDIRDGAFVPVAVKHVTLPGPAIVGSVLAVGVPEDPARARLFMEDPFACSPGEYYDFLLGHGHQAAPRPDHRAVLPGRICPWFKHDLIRAAAQSVVDTGTQRGQLFNSVWVGGAFTLVPEGHIGTALAAVAYIQLARDAIPGGDPARLAPMTLREWESACLEARP